MTDIIERLRKAAMNSPTYNICDEAAEEIERLRTEIYLLREAQKPINLHAPGVIIKPFGVEQ